MDAILLVEDDRFFREMYSNLLAAEGYEVDSASCGNEGLAMLARKNYGLVITDLIMPDISGMEILSRVRESDPTIDVIMVTGNANLESAIFALKHGARDYLVKPVNPDEFRHSVAQCMQQRRLLDENDELKNMIGLFQASQAIAGCLELDRVHHLLVDSLAREVGVGRAVGLFMADARLQLKETKGLTTAVAVALAGSLTALIGERYPGTHQVQRVRIEHGAADTPHAGIDEACLVHVLSRSGYQGVVALFNDEGVPLPDLAPCRKNIQFLTEQASHAFDNAETYSQARNMLFIDDVSGLFNHRYLEVALEREMKRVERYASHLAVLFIDVDAFKQINDTHGHLIGSRVLAEFGSLLKKSVRDVDVVIRYGGDEYTVILVETGCEVARMVAERIRRNVDEHRFLESDGYNIHVTCSIGYACCPEDAVSKQELLEMADRAMYVGKASGKNCIQRFLPLS